MFGDDPDLAHLAFERFTYSTPKVLWRLNRAAPDLDTVARQFRVFLDASVGGTSAIAIVAHSLGGLVVQRYLSQMVSEGAGLELQRIRRLILLATPNTGSDFLLSTRRIALPLTRQTLERALRPFDVDVSIAHSTVMNRIVHASGIDANQCKIPVVAYAGATDNVVKVASAFGAFRESGVLPGDHRSIVRPESPQDVGYQAIKRDLLRALGSATTVQADSLDELLDREDAPVDRSEFVAELTVPDGSILDPGQEFTKSWVIRNAGDVPWVGRSLRRVGGGFAPGIIIAPERVPIPDTPPGSEVRIDIPMTAPVVAAFTTCLYKMTDADGRFCFPDQYPSGLSAVITVMRNLE
jgi:pimeloyl-ACP methyl ester carboxylesterase